MNKVVLDNLIYMMKQREEYKKEVISPYFSEFEKQYIENLKYNKYIIKEIKKDSIFEIYINDDKDINQSQFYKKIIFNCRKEDILRFYNKDNFICLYDKNEEQKIKRVIKKGDKILCELFLIDDFRNNFSDTVYFPEIKKLNEKDKLKEPIENFQKISLVDEAFLKYLNIKQNDVIIITYKISSNLIISTIKLVI